MIEGPDAGKRTQSKKLADHFDVSHICTGKILREIISGEREDDVKKNFEKRFEEYTEKPNL